MLDDDLNGSVAKVAHAVKQNDSLRHISHFQPPLF